MEKLIESANRIDAITRGLIEDAKKAVTTMEGVDEIEMRTAKLDQARGNC